MGGQFEVKDGATKKYYSIAGMMVAMNDGSGLQYLVSTSSTRRLTDHLGSTVAVTNSSGTLTSQQRSLPFGAPRTIPNSPILGTDFTYTSQRKLDDGMGGVMDYRARFYSPYLNRFLQPDTIIPNQTNPQSWNRFSYGLNNPSRYTDPSGHMVACDDDDWACQTHWDEPIATEQLNKNYSQQLTEEQAEAWEFFIGASEIVASVLYEPVDWVLTYDDYKQNGFSPWMLAGILPGIPSSLAKRLDDVPWRSIVDEKYWETLEGAFKGDPGVYQLTGELDVFRRFSGDLKVSPWFSPKPYVYPGNARRYLALPDKNLATNIAEFVIPKDTKLLLGKAASQILDAFFGSHAVGGGLQIYLPNPFVAKRIK